MGRGAWLRSCKHCEYRLHHRSCGSLGIRGVSPTRSQNYRSCVTGRQGVVSCTHTHAHPLREAPRCRPLSGPQLWHKSDEPGFLTLKGGEGVRAEGRPEAFLSAGPQSCSQAGGVGSGLAARRIDQSVMKPLVGKSWKLTWKGPLSPHPWGAERGGHPGNLARPLRGLSPHYAPSLPSPSPGTEVSTSSRMMCFSTKDGHQTSSPSTSPPPPTMGCFSETGTTPWASGL